MEKPVVVGAAGTSGMREIVSISGPDQCGFHINPSDPSDIAWGIICASENSKRQIQFGRNGRKRILDLIIWEAEAKSTLERYSELGKPNEPKDSPT